MLGIRKLEPLGYRMALFYMTLHLAILVEHRLLTNTQTDRQTKGDSIHHASRVMHSTTANNTGQQQQKTTSEVLSS